jgi:hypothetical protein
VNLEANLLSYLGGDSNDPDRRKPDERYVSFDYCFNYFQSFRESGKTSELASPANVEVSCHHLWSYLASWGMLRNSELLEKNPKYLTGVVEVAAKADASVWEMGADSYNERNIRRLVELACNICDAMAGVSGTDALKTKIMLGVFGNVPGFDRNVSEGCKAEGMVGTFGKEALRKIAAFYDRNAAVISSEKYRVLTLDFAGGYTRRRYTVAKVIDMALFVEGERQLERKEQEKQERKQREAVSPHHHPASEAVPAPLR